MNQVLASYLRHLATSVVVAAVVVVNTNHVAFAHLSKGDIVAIANAVWIAALPQLRFGLKTFAEPFLNAYLKKQYPALGIIVKDLEEFNAYAAAAPTTTAVTAKATASV